MRAPLSARRAGDESDLALYTSCHVFQSFWWWVLSDSGNEGGHGFPAPDRRGLGRMCVRPVDLPRRESLENFLERDSALETRQRIAHTEVRSRAECHVRVLLSMDVEN